MLVGIFQKKQQAVMIRAFNNIKHPSSPSKKRSTNLEKKELPDSTRRTNLMTSHAKEDAHVLHIHINKPIR
jgi:hypothetical protein